MLLPTFDALFLSPFRKIILSALGFGAPGSTGKMIVIATAHSDVDLGHVRDLMRAFIAWHQDRHREDMHLVSQYFDPLEFEEELATLPGKYGPPSGCLLLALHDGQPAGCVALRKLGPDACEMKRMFVYSKFHGLGIGARLAEAIVSRAKELGHSRIVLDTGAKQVEAQGLYHRLGFRDIEPYYELPEGLKSWLTFMELDLRSPQTLAGN